MHLNSTLEIDSYLIFANAKISMYVLQFSYLLWVTLIASVAFSPKANDYNWSHFFVDNKII